MLAADFEAGFGFGPLVSAGLQFDSAHITKRLASRLSVDLLQQLVTSSASLNSNKAFCLFLFGLTHCQYSPQQKNMYRFCGHGILLQRLYIIVDGIDMEI